ncbi:divergent polysaccharide deacetylase family protein [Falsiroseomonas sp. E2-1-a20]|uniref:divergent polysaccharide deacetylase family protein n=1 Tax=Falsiroseomonas sp. E2-1-a20 TaxID=3239300 RepID=UPI003F34D10E
MTRGRRALGAFWAVVVLALVAGTGTLQWLGPPDAASVAAPATPAAADPAPPAPAATVVAEPFIEAPVPAAAEPIAATGAPVRTEPPAAPAPPPLVTPVAMPQQGAAEPRIAEPEPEMLERTRAGLVPKLGPDGRTSIRHYARPFDRDAERRPRIGLIIGNMGLFAQHSEEAIRRLPGAVTLAFSPYAQRPEPLLERARARGMEVLTALPLEPAGYGQFADPGDRALLTGRPVEENLERLDWALSRMQGQVGAIGALGRLRGERFAANAELLGIIQAALTTRGLLYIDPRPGAPTPARAFGRTVDLILDEPSETRSEVERRLTELEALALRNGSALGLLGNPTPFFTAAILAWSAGLEDRGAVLAPVTVLLRRPGTQAAR